MILSKRKALAYILTRSGCCRLTGARRVAKELDNNSVSDRNISEVHDHKRCLEAIT